MSKLGRLPLRNKTRFSEAIDTNRYDPEEIPVIEKNLDRANLITSESVGVPGYHRPVIDLDLPATLLPSSTPGHHHLFIDHLMSWPSYVSMLNALVDAGLVEPGWVDASVHRGFTATRLPWVRKERVDA